MIIVIIARFLENFSENPTVKSVFYGIRPTVAALIGYAVWELLQIAIVVTRNGVSQIDILSALICLAAFLLLQIKQLKKLHPLVWIAAGAVIGILFQL